jgi:hypothetical protein
MAPRQLPIASTWPTSCERPCRQTRRLYGTRTPCETGYEREC